MSPHGNPSDQNERRTPHGNPGDPYMREGLPVESLVIGMRE